MLSGAAIRIPASQIVPMYLLRSLFASARPKRREAARVKYSRPSKKPLRVQKINRANGAKIR